MLRGAMRCGPGSRGSASRTRTGLAGRAGASRACAVCLKSSDGGNCKAEKAVSTRSSSQSSTALLLSHTLTDAKAAVAAAAQLCDAADPAVRTGRTLRDGVGGARSWRTMHSPALCNVYSRSRLSQPPQRSSVSSLSSGIVMILNMASLTAASLVASRSPLGLTKSRACECTCSRVPTPWPAEA
eukprot:6212146-Pleurochrysis_carterae.AAC.2